MTKLTFESSTCSRCGGTGWMPFAAYGGVCFKCNGRGEVATPAGRSARKLYNELLTAASATKQAWEIEVGETVCYATDADNRWFTVIEKDFRNGSGEVVDGHACSAMLVARKTIHMARPDAEMRVKPASPVVLAIMTEVDRRRKGATLVQEVSA